MVYEDGDLSPVARRAEREEGALEPASDLGGLVESGDFDSSRLTRMQRDLLRFYDSNLAFCGRATAAEVAEKAGVSEATAVRLAKTLGFPGYKAFRNVLQERYLRALTPLSQFQQQGHETSIGTAFRKQVLQDVRNLQVSLELVSEEQLGELASLILGARSVVVLASGSYASVGAALVHILGFLGIRSVLEERDAPSLAATLLPLDSRDLVIAFSFWRVVKSTALGVKWARRHGVPTFAITDSELSPLTSLAERSLIVSVESDAFFFSMISPLSLVYGLGSYLGHVVSSSQHELIQRGDETIEFFGSTYNTKETGTRRSTNG